MHVEVGNFYYFLYFAIAILITVSLILILKNKDDKVKNKVILFLLFSAFFLHFCKNSYLHLITRCFLKLYVKVSFENICAISTLVFPFIFLSKSKILKDYMIRNGDSFWYCCIYLSNRSNI